MKKLLLNKIAFLRKNPYILLILCAFIALITSLGVPLKDLAGGCGSDDSSEEDAADMAERDEIERILISENQSESEKLEAIKSLVSRGATICSEEQSFVLEGFEAITVTSEGGRESEARVRVNGKEYLFGRIPFPTVTQPGGGALFRGTSQYKLSINNRLSNLSWSYPTVRKACPGIVSLYSYANISSNGSVIAYTDIEYNGKITIEFRIASYPSRNITNLEYIFPISKDRQLFNVSGVNYDAQRRRFVMGDASRSEEIPARLELNSFPEAGVLFIGNRNGDSGIGWMPQTFNMWTRGNNPPIVIDNSAADAVVLRFTPVGASVTVRRGFSLRDTISYLVEEVEYPTLANKDAKYVTHYNRCQWPAFLTTANKLNNNIGLNSNGVIPKMYEFVENYKIDSDENLRNKVHDGNALYEGYARNGDYSEYETRIADNRKVKDITYAMACKYKDLVAENNPNAPIYGQKASVLIKRFSEVVNGFPMKTRQGFAPSAPILASREYMENPPAGETIDWYFSNNGIWDMGFGLDYKEGLALLFSYEILRDAGFFNSSERSDIEESLKSSVEFTFRQFNGQWYDNMSGDLYINIIPSALILNEPELIHRMLSKAKAFLNWGWYSDGRWHEGSTSYHQQITYRMLDLFRILEGYSDPRGFVSEITRRNISNFNTRNEMGHHLDTITKSADFMTFPRTEENFEAVREDPVKNHPKRATPIINDTHSGEFHTAMTDPDKRTSNPYLFRGLGMGILGSGEGPSQAQVFLDFGGTHGHEQYDSLNMMLWALEGELLSGTDYRYGQLLRWWGASTAAHNTVVIDELDQLGRGDERFTLSDWDNDDKVDGAGQNGEAVILYLQSAGQGTTNHDGNLKLFSYAPLNAANFRHPVQVIEADGKNAYGNAPPRRTDVYRRALIMVKIDDDNFYLVDVFRVRGGRTNDWMLHGNLAEDYNFRFYQHDQAGVATEVNMDRAQEEIHRIYYGNSFAESLEITGRKQTDATFSTEFVSSNNTHIRTTMLGVPGTTVLRGRANALRRDADATFLDIRRTHAEKVDTVFAVIHEPYRGDAPRISRITSLMSSHQSSSDVVFKVELPDRVDYIAQTLDEPPYPVKHIEDNGNNIRYAGRVMHVSLSRGNNSIEKMYLLEGRGICVNGEGFQAESGDFSYRGNINNITTNSNGTGTFATDAILPTNGILNGRTILLTMGDSRIPERTQGFTIESVSRVDGRTNINVREAPGLEFRQSAVDGRAGERIIKFTNYPFYSIRGNMNFLISGSVYKNRDGLVESSGALSGDTSGICR